MTREGCKENRSYRCVGPGFTITKLGQTTGPDRLAIKDFIVVTSACPRQGAGGEGPQGVAKKGYYVITVDTMCFGGVAKTIRRACYPKEVSETILIRT